MLVRQGKATSVIICVDDMLSSTTSLSSADWKTIPHNQKLRYSQLFNQHDRHRKGFVSGVEAKSVLSQTGLTHTQLAQIWYRDCFLL